MSGHAVYQVQTPVYDDGAVEDECVFIQAVHFTASLPRARQFNLTIIRSGRQIGFTGPGRVFDFYYKQASLGDYYCKRLAVVVACFSHTCVNTVGLASQLHARVDIPIPLACGYRKDLAWEDQIPRCVCVCNGCQHQNDWPVRGKSECSPHQCLCIHGFFFSPLPIIILIIEGRNA